MQYDLELENWEHFIFIYSYLFVCGMGICTLYLFLGVHAPTCEDTHAYYVHMYT